jgi:hypothetical protein
VENEFEQRFVLEGRLTKDTLAELEAAWQSAMSARGSRRPVVDLRNATFIDPSAESLLLEMKRSGAMFLASGVCTRFRLDELGICCE